jgi:GTP cyclohydrolase I
VNVVELSWENVRGAAEELFQRHHDRIWKHGIYGIPRGGTFVTLLIREHLLVEGRGVGSYPPLVEAGQEIISKDTLIVDDLVDSGKTLEAWEDKGWTVDALFRKPMSPPHLAAKARWVDGWARFPWEEDEKTGPERNVLRLLQWLGEDTGREGLVETPGRVCRALQEMTAGNNEDPKHILSKWFRELNDSMVMLKGIRFSSVCEHHLLPFTGTATVAYIPKMLHMGDSGFEKWPDGSEHQYCQVVGISKLARLVECFARRLQNQERLAIQIADAINKNLWVKGVGVILSAHHGCMGCRGVRQPDAQMVTSSLRGVMLNDARSRDEFLRLAL